MARSILDELIDRGLINQHEQDGKKVPALTNETAMRELLAREKITIYIGFDPTALSLHVGSLLPIMTLARFQRFGHRPIVLVGGATGMIGDPSGRTDERQLLSVDEIDKNVKALRAQLERYVSFEGENAALVLNNYDWIGRKSYLEWLREVGKLFTVNYMQAKESVRARLEDREQGITYTEFSYMLLQAYDFYHLFTEHGCVMQGGGSDQWGNITAGTDLIRKRTGKEAFGMTYPLITTSSGEKFGKSAGNAVWLDPDWTSPYAFYQYWLNAGDADVEKYFKFFSFKSLDEIASICHEHLEAPEKRYGQKELAADLTRLVHGEEGLAKAEQATQVLFGSSLEGLSEKDLLDIFKDVPSTEIARGRIESGLAMAELLVDAGACKSRGEARRLIRGGGVSLNNERVDDTELVVTPNHLASGSLMIVRLGKKRYHLVKSPRT
jgi:tyrosyl-tRNA synthetase